MLDNALSFHSQHVQTIISLLLMCETQNRIHRNVILVRNPRTFLLIIRFLDHQMTKEIDPHCPSPLVHSLITFPLLSTKCHSLSQYRFHHTPHPTTPEETKQQLFEFLVSHTNLRQNTSQKRPPDRSVKKN